MAKNNMWNTGTKRIVTITAMAVVGYANLTNSYAQLPKLPAFFTTPFAGINIITLGSAFLIYAAWMLIDNQLNG